MKKLAIATIKIYQTLFSGFLHQLTGTQSACRFDVTCSEYSKIAISENGVLKGTYLSIARLLKCQPFYNIKY